MHLSSSSPIPINHYHPSIFFLQSRSIVAWVPLALLAAEFFGWWVWRPKNPPPFLMSWSPRRSRAKSAMHRMLRPPLPRRLVAAVNGCQRQSSARSATTLSPGCLFLLFIMFIICFVLCFIIYVFLLFVFYVYYFVFLRRNIKKTTSTLTSLKHKCNKQRNARR